MHQHTSQYTCPMHPQVIKDAEGVCPKCGMDLVPVGDQQDHHQTHTQHHHKSSAEPKEHIHHAEAKYICPMHPMVIKDAPGICPMCGMELVPMEHAGHHDEKSDHHAGHHGGMIEDFKRRFYVVLALTFPIIALSPMIQHWLGVDWSFPGSTYLLMALSTVVYIHGGWPFLTGLRNELRAKSPGMMTLVAVAITVAYIYSVAIVFGLSGMDFFWELATLILIMLLGHWIEMRSIQSASRELELLVQLIPADAHLVHGDHVMDVRTDSLKAGDIILIKPGEKIAADGIIREGNSSLNESMLTGESKPVEKSVGEKVIAGSINGNGALRVEVSHGMKDSYLSQVIKLVQDAQQNKSKTQLLADNAARWLTIIALASGAITFIAWLVAGHNLAFAMERMVTVIVICCPHALGLAVPLVVARSTAISAQSGLLIKNRTAFENSRKITTLVFDKTGTLTIGKFTVVRYESLISMYDANKILAWAAALEQNSEHPIATGILDKAKELKLALPKATSFQAMTGKGIQARIENQTVMVVSPGYLEENKHEVPVAETRAETVVYLMIENTVAGVIALADEIRKEAPDAIQRLRASGIKTLLLTGDNKDVAREVSEKLGMDGFIAEVLPHEKLSKIKELQSKGEFVAMTGDGVNDAPALAQADVGIAVGSGSDIAAETAGIVLVNSNPQDVANLILFGKATYKKMIQNLVWATGYNVVALPLAAGVLYSFGVMLSPAAGAVLMSISTVVVAFNARMLAVAGRQ